MPEFLSTIDLSPQWVFIALGGVLLIIELLGTNGYSLWSGVSAFIVSVIAWIFPLYWSILWLLFAIFTCITAYVWWLWLTKHQTKDLANISLNQPQKELIGLKTVVVEPIKNGYGRVKIKDGTWTAINSEDLPVGEKVQVVAVEGTALHVVKITSL